jgi:hypothetical protein
MAAQAEPRWRGWFRLAASMGAALACGATLQPAFAQPSGADGNDFLYRVQQGDTLIALADRYMGDAEGWRLLQQRNHVANPYHLCCAFRSTGFRWCRQRPPWCLRAMPPRATTRHCKPA